MDYSSLSKEKISFSAPCRIDMGGTLDISTFYVPLSFYSPSTFNIALNLRTKAAISPFDKGFVKISSKGFESAVFKKGEAPFTHKMGMMFAIASHFNIDGVHIEIESTSPPKSGLGGSSVAAVAITSTFLKLLNPERPVNKDFNRDAAIIAHNIENSTLGVPCGTQDHLAAAFGGVNQWKFNIKDLYTQNPVLKENEIQDFSDKILVAYCGEPHESVDINGRWVKGFLNGKNREKWIEICELSNSFSHALRRKDIKKAIEAVNREVDLRVDMTPDVFDKTGQKFLESAKGENCSARFTGAGGGGCIWALGEKDDIKSLRTKWQEITTSVPNAGILDCGIDTKGVEIMMRHE